jgi:hypothetical protein
MDPLQALVGIKTTHLLAGIAGGTVRAFLAGGGVVSGISSVVVGALTASYVSPLALEYFPGTVADKSELAVVFLVGLTGMLICEGVTKFVKSWSRNPKLPGQL